MNKKNVEAINEKTQILNRWTSAILYQADGTIKEVLEKAVEKNADLGGAYLEDANLGGANLKGANLGGAYLGGAYLKGADLGGADLGGANLKDANFGDADLGGADLRDANLRDADLRGAYLRGAYLDKNILNAKWGVPSDPYTAFILLSLKVVVPHDLAIDMLLTPGFCWDDATKYLAKYPELFNELKTAWPELYTRLGGK